MSKSKVMYGIDLGTTNSSISCMEIGIPKIIKTDTLKDTLPSCIYFNKKQSIQIGDSAYSALKRDKLRAMTNWDSTLTNSFIEFKRTMGSEKKYFSSNMNSKFSSEELSAEVLKALKSFVKDDIISSIIITVPAQFAINQKDATMRAGKIAGFEYTELLLEPIAASLAYGLNAKKKEGFWLVFDFGGGTFDAALLKVEEGIMKVIDTDGDNWLGGKNLDYAIVDDLIIPWLKENFKIENILANDEKKEILRDAMKFYAESAKIQLSFNESYNILSDLGDIPGEDDEGNEFELDITVTLQDLEKVFKPHFQRAIDLCLELLQRNNLSGADLETLLLVGGPTFSSILRTMLEKQIKKPNTSVDPMTVVSKGAALYASTIDVPEVIRDRERDKTKIQLQVGYESTTIEEEEFVTIKVVEEKTDGKIPDKIFCELVRADKAWSSGKVQINTTGEVIEVKLNLNAPNLFNINLYDEQTSVLQFEPDNFTIIQGSKVLSSILSNNIGIAIHSRVSKEEEFRTISGLEKNRSLPATGTTNHLFTQKQLRPGNKNDFIKIPVLEGKDRAEGSKPIYNIHVFDALITGNDLPALLPEGSEVELTVEFKNHGKILLSAFFPLLEHSVEVEYDSSNGIQSDISAEWLQTEIEKAKQTLNLIIQEDVAGDKDSLNELETRLNELEKKLEQGKGDFDRRQEIQDNLRESCKRLDRIHSETKWPKIETELQDVFYHLESTNKEFGNEKTNSIIEQYRDSIPKVIKEKNVRVAEDIIDQMRNLDFTLIDQGLGAQMEIGLLHQFNDDFDMLVWDDENRARILIDQGFNIAANNPSKDRLRPIILELYRLLPTSQQPITIDNSLLQG
jgi:molecular chaperone DnaK